MKFNDVLKDIKNYEAGKPIELVVREYGIDPKDIVKLASNENPYGCSLHVKEAVSKPAEAEIIRFFKILYLPKNSFLKI